jgi:CHAT domain-containing protein
LIEEMAISYVNSGPEAAALLGTPQSGVSGGLLAAGAIDFLADPGRAAPRHPAQRPVDTGERQRGGFSPLPGTKAEGEMARDLFRRAFPSQRAMFLTGGEPTESEIKKLLDSGQWRAVHLGTHGFFEDPGRIAALRASTRRQMHIDFTSKPEKADDESFSLELGPFLNSGIVLAGGGRAPDTAQPRPPGSLPQSEDGILTAEEVQSLDMSGTEMVVLSACETGLGQSLYGQGMLGLQRAFHVAGAKAVIASLWKVEDAATSVLMEQFYTNLWVKKMPKLESLRQAQLTVLNNPGLVTARRTELAKRGIEEKPEKLPQSGAIASPNGSARRSDPSLWAAFVLSGDWR